MLKALYRSLIYMFMQFRFVIVIPKYFNFDKSLTVLLANL
jgi:hypothetical protein